MNKIILLDDKLINKIAAGEVVERPASIVKELVENSIDANSKNISIEIFDGGIPYIKVSDDGNGMNEVDSVLAFSRHATSKIKADKDLYSINTLGFRGEALASIAAISKVTLLTREETSQLGVKLSIEGGKILEKQPSGCQKGTSVEIKDVFYNTPARRKFLKRPSTEAMYISDIIIKIALSHPEISFKYLKDKKLQFITSGNKNIEDVIIRLFGSDIIEQLLYSNYKDEYLNIKIYMGKNSLNKSNRNMQFFFVNGRYIKNKTLTAAVDEAYKTYIPINRYPVVFMYINIDPRQIDVNIHPSKLEIKFSDEKTIFNTVYDIIKNTLKSNNLIPDGFLNKVKPTFKFNEVNNKIVGKQEKIEFNSLKNEHQKNNNIFEEIKNQDNQDNNYSNDKITNEFYQHQNNESKICENNTQTSEFETKYNKLKEEISDIKIIGTLFSTYIIVEKEDVFYIIDQHAAHERILYEKFMNKFDKVQAKQTTFPIVVNLQYNDLEILNDEKELIENLGFRYEQFGGNSVILREVPVILGQPEAKQLFIDIIEKLKDKEITNKIHLKEENITMMACKAAVKAMDKLSNEEIIKLFEDLKVAENPYTCPHGRPLIVSITKNQLEKMFKRIM